MGHPWGHHGAPLTGDLGLEGAANDVVGAAILDGDEVVAGGHGGVGDAVALGALHAVQRHLGGAVNGDRQRPGAGVGRLHHELRAHPCGAPRAPLVLVGTHRSRRGSLGPTGTHGAHCYSLVVTDAHCNPLAPLRTHGYPLALIVTHWYPLLPTGTHWNTLAPIGTHWCPLVLTGAH